MLLQARWGLFEGGGGTVGVAAQTSASCLPQASSRLVHGFGKTSDSVCWSSETPRKAEGEGLVAISQTGLGSRSVSASNFWVCGQCVIRPVARLSGFGSAPCAPTAHAGLPEAIRHGLALLQFAETCRSYLRRRAEGPSTALPFLAKCRKMAAANTVSQTLLLLRSPTCAAAPVGAVAPAAAVQLCFSKTRPRGVRSLCRPRLRTAAPSRRGM